MQKLIVLLLLLVAGSQASGQVAATRKGLPMIDLTLTNGERYTNRDVKPGPLVLIYFSPDCEHCQQFITAFLQREKLVKSRQILLASFVEVSSLASFGKTMGMERFPNIRMGTEGESYRIARGLVIRKFPYVALYDGARNLIRTFEGEQPFGQIIEAIENL